MLTHPPARSLAKKTQKVQEIDLCSSTPPASRDPTPANDSPGAIEVMPVQRNSMLCFDREEHNLARLTDSLMPV